MTEFFDVDEEEVDDGAHYAVRPNKTLLKKEIAALFALGEEMSRLPAEQLRQLSLPDSLEQAIVQVAAISSNGARKRQLKFIAGQLHKTDLQGALEKLAQFKSQSAHAVREHHLAERWRDRLLAEADDEALTELFDTYPEADRQALRQLVRAALKERAAAKPPRAFRLLYQQLKALVQSEQAAGG